MNDILAREINLPPLGALEYNTLLFGCHSEEEHSYGQGNYSIPQNNSKQLVYAGFAGVYQTILKSKRENSLSEGLYENLRQGNWLLNYYLGRIKRFKHMK
jgi:glycogen debranching enzyme